MSKNSSNIIFYDLITFKNVNDTVSNLGYLTSNVLSNQKFINSNSISDILIPYLTSNVLSNQKFINSNSISDILIPYLTSNVLSQQKFINSNFIQTSISTDFIKAGASNKFIVNDRYENDITFKKNVFSSNIITSNLFVIDKYTVLNTTIYETEQLQVVNNTTAPALVIKQIETNQNVAEFYNNTNPSLIIDNIGNTIFGGNLIPNSNENYNLGSETQKWKDLFLSGKTIHLDDLVISKNSLNNLEIKDKLNNFINLDLNQIKLNNKDANVSVTLNLNSTGTLEYITKNGDNEPVIIYPVLNNPGDPENSAITSNVLRYQKFISSNSINDILIPYVSSNVLGQQQFINSNSIRDVLTPFITSNVLSNVSSFYISSNVLGQQQFINSNFIQNSISSDFIKTPLGSSNKFIVNNKYDNDITFTKNVFSSNIITSNLFVIDNYTVLNTSVYETEQLEIFNNGTATALKITQKTSNQNVAEFYNNDYPSFIIDKNSNVSIGKINPNSNYSLDVNGIINSLDVKIDSTSLSNIYII